MSDQKVKVTITLDGKQYTAEIDRAEQKTKEFGEQGKKSAADVAHLQTSVKSLSGEIAALIQNQLSWRSVMGSLGIGAMTYEVVTQTKAIIDAGNASIKFSAALKAVTGDNASAADEMRFVREEADRLGVSFTALLGPYTQIAAASRNTALEGAATRDIFKAVTEASRVFGLSGPDTEGVLRAIAQMMSKGTVQAEELRGQLGDRLPGAFKLAAQAMGKTEAEFNKMLETGQVLAADLLPKLATELHKAVSAGLVDAQHSPAAEFERLGNALTDLKTTIAKSGVLDFFRDMAVATRGVVENLNTGVTLLKLYLNAPRILAASQDPSAPLTGTVDRHETPEQYGARMAVEKRKELREINLAKLRASLSSPQEYGADRAETARLGYPESTMTLEEQGKRDALYAGEELKRARAEHDRVAAQHEVLYESLLNEEEKIRESYARRAEIVGNAHQQGLIDEQQAKAELLVLEADFQAKRTKLAIDAENKQRNLRIDAAKNYASAFTAISSIFANESEEAFETFKGFAKAEAAINSLRAFTSVLADPMLPTWAKIPAAASVLAAGIEKMHQINVMRPGGNISGGAGAVPTYPANPLTSFPVDDAKGGGATQIIIQGNIYGFDDFRERVTEAVKDAVDNRDVVIISGNSRQAAELRG